MCGHYRNLCCPIEETVSEREKLEKAIARLEARKWCPDAMLALDAAKKWLATLPKPDRWALRSDHAYFEYGSYLEAVEAGKRALECGAATVSVSKVR